MSELAENLVTNGPTPAVADEWRLIADGCLGGILLTYVLFFYSALQNPGGYYFLLIIYLPPALIVGGLVGSLLGGLLLLAQYWLSRQLGFWLRVLLVAVLLVAGYGFLIAASSGTQQFVESLVPLCVMGLALGLLVAACAAAPRNIWTMLGRGCRTTSIEAPGFPLVSGAALRLFSVFGLMMAVFSLACLFLHCQRTTTMPLYFHFESRCQHIRCPCRSGSAPCSHLWIDQHDVTRRRPATGFVGVLL